jgi:hypothetical protein
LEAVRSDVARGKALEFLVERAKALDESGNEIDLTLPEDPEQSPVSEDQDEASESEPPTAELHEERSEA